MGAPSTLRRGDNPARPSPDEVVWRVFSVRARAEKRAAERLAAAGIKVYLPLRVALHQWSDRKKRVEVPLFSGYVFAHVDERQRLRVLEDEAVTRTVAFGGVPAVVADDEIALLRTFESMPDQIEAVTQRAFPVGAEVILTNGPLKGIRGHVSSYPKESYLTVDVPSLRQAIRVQVPSDWAMRPPGDGHL